MLNTLDTPQPISWLRIALLVVGLLALLPLGLMFGLAGFLVAFLLVLLAALAK
jgi:hypothetical protein